jgi:hypothetical protein
LLNRFSIDFNKRIKWLHCCRELVLHCLMISLQ